MTDRDNAVCEIQINDPDLERLVSENKKDKQHTNNTKPNDSTEKPNDSTEKPTNPTEKQGEKWWGYLMWGLGILLGVIIMLLVWRYVLVEDETLG